MRDGGRNLETFRIRNCFGFVDSGEIELGDTQLSKQSINDLVSDLEKRGYLERTPDPTDGRARIVRLTQRGWDLTQVLSDMSFATESEWARAIGEERFAEFRDTLFELVAYASPSGEAVVRGRSAYEVWLRSIAPGRASVEHRQRPSEKAPSTQSGE